MLDLSLKQELIEIFSLSSFKPDEVNEIGITIFNKFDLHQISNTRSIETLSIRKAAGILVDYCIEKNKVLVLLEFLIQIDDSLFLGKPVVIDGLESLLLKLSLIGYTYNPVKRKIVHGKEDPMDQKNWGALKEEKSYSMTILSLDIVENSHLVKTYGSGKMKKLYASLWSFLRERLSRYNGRIWSWAGDGGLIAFAMKNHLIHSVQFAIEVQNLMVLFNHDPAYSLKEPIKLRMGLDSGKVPFSFSTGQIVSEVINYAAHLEKGICKPGSIAVSSAVYIGMGTGYSDFFKLHSVFEGTEAYISTPISMLDKVLV